MRRFEQAFGSPQGAVSASAKVRSKARLSHSSKGRKRGSGDQGLGDGRANRADIPLPPSAFRADIPLPPERFGWLQPLDDTTEPYETIHPDDF